MIEHQLKISTEFLDDILFRYKSFEIRRNDRDFQVGDLLCLIDPLSRKAYFYVKYIFEGGRFGLDHGYVCMSIEPRDGYSR